MSDAIVDWSDELLASMEPVRGVSTSKRSPSLGAWKKLHARAQKLAPKWTVFLASGLTTAPIAARALERLALPKAPPPGGAELEGAVLGVLAFRDTWAMQDVAGPALDYLVAAYDLAFALRACVASLSTWVEQYDHRGPQSFGPRQDLRDTCAGSGTTPFTALRAHLACASEADHALALEAARELWEKPPHPLARPALAYAFPGEEDWAHAIDGSQSIAVATSSRDEALVVACLARGAWHIYLRYAERSCAPRVAAMLAMVGPTPRLVTALFALLDTLHERAQRRELLDVLARIGTVDALRALTERVVRDDVPGALQSAMARFPSLAVPPLAELAATRGKAATLARSLLRALLRSPPADLDAIVGSLDEAERRQVGALRAAEVTIAPDELLPPCLRSAPTLAKPGMKRPPLPKFASTSMLPAPTLRAGGALPASAVGHLLEMMAISHQPEAPYPGLGEVRDACTPASLAAFASALLDAWLAAGGVGKEAWAMNGIAWFGDAACVRTLAELVRAWPGESAHQRAILGLHVLATIRTDVALMHLHAIAQKAKFKALQESAQRARFADYEILQPFVQLGREIFTLEPGERSAFSTGRFAGRSVSTGAVLGLEARGWTRGAVSDGGWIDVMQKTLPGPVYATLDLAPGMVVGLVKEHPVQTLGKLALLARTFGSIDPITVSELFRDVATLAG